MKINKLVIDLSIAKVLIRICPI